MNNIRFSIIRFINSIFRKLTKIPGCPRFIRELVVAAALGYSSDSIKQKRFKEAYDELMSVVDLNLSDSDPYLTRARYMISYLYYEGQGVQKNKTKAIEYLMLSAKGGHQDAINKLREIESQ